MAPSTHNTTDDWIEKLSAREEHYSSHSAPPEPKRRVDSRDITGCGGHVPDTVATRQDGYPPDLDVSEDEDAAGLSDSLHLSPSYAPLQMWDDNGPSSHDSSPSTARPSGRKFSVDFGLYTDASDLVRLRKEKRRARSGESSAYGPDSSSSSQYISAKDYPASNTTYDPSGNGDDDDEGDGASQNQTPYFSPSSHTPSHRSLGTQDVGYEDDGEDRRAPQSPLPFSNFYLHDESYGRGAVEDVDRFGVRGEE